MTLSEKQLATIRERVARLDDGSAAMRALLNVLELRGVVPVLLDEIERLEEVLRTTIAERDRYKTALQDILTIAEHSADISDAYQRASQALQEEEPAHG